MTDCYIEETYISKGKKVVKKRPAIEVDCTNCSKKHLRPKKYGVDGNIFCSKKCSHEFKKSKRKRVNCDLCKEPFERVLSSLKKSKSGLNFCSRKCKDEAQRFDSGF